ncbi:MAG: hypothetical protein PVG07_12450 [Acidobacteriota bacterium]|jgi:hypothetical protein
MKLRNTLIVAALALLIALPAAAQDLWIHVKVHEEGGENTRVTVNLPVSFLEGVLPMLEESGHMEDAQIEFDDSDISADDLRRVLQSLKDSPDATFAEVETDTETVVFYKQGDYLRVETEESHGGTEVQARFPIAVLDALLSAPDDRLDLRAAIQALAAHGPGELVTVRDGATSVRVWIDEYAEAE